jgi:hypothetical protein
MTRGQSDGYLRAWMREVKPAGSSKVPMQMASQVIGRCMFDIGRVVFPFDPAT